MKRTDDNYKKCIAVLREELIPATGCTEPIALAYAAAMARQVLESQPELMKVRASNNIIKNVKSVIVPNTGGLKGIEAAVAAGVVAGNINRRLDVIASVSDEDKLKIKAFLRDTPITVISLDSDHVLDIIVEAYSGSNHVTVQITDFHTNIVYIEKNGSVLKSSTSTPSNDETLTDRSFLSMELIYDFANCVLIDDIDTLIENQITCNYAIAEEGLKENYGANIGQVLMSSRTDEVKIKAMAYAAAGSDARMSGCEMPVVINSGSGNQGMAASLPIIIYAREEGYDRDVMIRALVLSNLISIYEKSKIGRLSAYCGAISAGCAAGAGVAYMEDGSYDAVSHTLSNALGIASGVICDGAKSSCAGKIMLGVDAGILGYELYKWGHSFTDGEGIVKADADKTISSIGKLAREGMQETDQVILEIMLEPSRIN